MTNKDACREATPTSSERERWILQRDPIGNAFWDTYLHPECVLIRKQEKHPLYPYNDDTPLTSKGA